MKALNFRVFRVLMIGSSEYNKVTGLNTETREKLSRLFRVSSSFIARGQHNCSIAHCVHSIITSQRLIFFLSFSINRKSLRRNWFSMKLVNKNYFKRRK